MSSGCRKCADCGRWGKCSRDLRLCIACGAKRREAGNSLGGQRGSKAAKRRAGETGGAACGEAKARRGSANGRWRQDVDKPCTWQPLCMDADQIEHLMTLMHGRRENKAPKPWLRLGDLPSEVVNEHPEDAKRILEVLTQTRVGHPDRYRDYVSREIARSLPSS